MLTYKPKTVLDMIPDKGWVQTKHERPAGKPSHRVTIQKGVTAITTYVAKNGVFQKIRFKDKVIWAIPKISSVAA